MRAPCKAQGERHPRAALSNRSAESLRARYMTGETTLRSLAREAGVSHRTVWRIVNGYSYRDDRDE